MMISYLKNTTSKTLILKFGIIAFISNLILKLWSVPYIKSITNKTSFDLSIKGYNLQYALNYISSMSDEIIKFYSYVQIPIDIIFPISTAFFSLMLLAYFNRTVDVNSSLYLLPILCCIFDLTENILIFIMLNWRVTSTIVKLSSTLTILKFTTGLIYSATFILIFYNFRKVRTKYYNM